MGDPAPEGQSAYSTFQARYRETSWRQFLDVRTAAAKTGWTCQGLEDLGPDLPSPAERCFIQNVPGEVSCNSGEVTVTEEDIANRYAFNLALPVVVDRPSGERFLAFYVQQNVWVGKHSAGSFGCPWKEASGPASWLQSGGDEFVVFTAPATLAGARGEELVLTDDVTRPDDSCYYQVQSAVWEANRGPDGRMTLFGKCTDEGPNHGPRIQMDQLLFNRFDDPRDVPQQGWEIMAIGCHEACADGECPCTAEDVVGPGYRITDLNLVDETTTSEWDYVGFLGWFRKRQNSGDEATCPVEIEPRDPCPETYGAAAIRLKTRSHIELRDNQGQWRRLPWATAPGETPSKINFELERTVKERIGRIHKAKAADGGDRYEMWHVRKEKEGIRGGISPCLFQADAALALYEDNVSKYINPKGRFVRFQLWNPDPEILRPVLGESYVIYSGASRIWNTPGDYNMSHSWNVGRLELEIEGEYRHFLYSANRDALMCVEPMLLNRNDVAWDRGSGKSVTVSEIEYLATPVLFGNGFESGTTLQWSATVGRDRSP